MKQPIALLCVLISSVSLMADDWPQWLGPRRDGVWRETGILKRFPETGLKVLWRTPIGPGYTGPAVAGKMVIAMDRTLAKGARNPTDPFERDSIPGAERIVCLDRNTGALLWKHEYPAAYTISYPKGPRATPVIDGERAYTLGAEGHLVCLKLDNGKPVWNHHFAETHSAKTPTWGFAAHPLVDGERLICLVGGKDSAVVAFDKKTGRELWRRLTSKDIGYCPPVIYEAGGVRQLIIWLVGGVHALNPETGDIYWSHKWHVRGGGSIAMPRKLGDRLFLSTFFNGSLMLKLHEDTPTASLLWQSPKTSVLDTIHLHALNSVPWLEDGHIYGVCNYGQFRCLEIETGKRKWESLEPLRLAKTRRNATAFIVRHEDRFFITNDSGDLIIADLTPDGYKEIDSVRLIEPTDSDSNRPIVWSHPAFANRRVYARNDREIICVSLEE